MNNKFALKIAGGVLAGMVVVSGLVAVGTNYYRSTTVAADPTAETTQNYAEAQITGTGQFTLVSVDVDGGDVKTSATPQELANFKPLTVTSEGGKLTSTLPDGKPSTLLEGNWVSSRGVTYDGQKLLVDTYSIDGVNSNDGTPTKAITIVVSNLTTGFITIHQEFTSNSGNAKFNYEAVR